MTVQTLEAGRVLRRQTSALSCRTTLLCVFVVSSIAACASQSPAAQPKTLQMEAIKLRWSNAFVIRGPSGDVLIDSGSPRDFPQLAHALAEVGSHVRKLRAVVLTHAHGDHAATAADLQQLGVAVLVGAGDADMLAVGVNRPSEPQSALAQALQGAFDFHYRPVQHPVLVEAPTTLATYGLPEVEVLPMPGHTRGSLVVVLPNNTALVGDLILGGSLGGALCPSSPGPHYFHEDSAKNLANIRELLRRGITTFYLGHGGPVDAGDVTRAFFPNRR